MSLGLSWYLERYSNKAATSASLTAIAFPSWEPDQYHHLDRRFAVYPAGSAKTDYQNKLRQGMMF